MGTEPNLVRRGLHDI